MSATVRRRGCLVDRRIGGLEIAGLTVPVKRAVDRRIGGLENIIAPPTVPPTVDRRIGGLEKI